MNGKIIRIKRLMPDSKSPVFFLPIDHGFSFGPMLGLSNLDKLFKEIIQCNLDAIILHKGIANQEIALPLLCNTPFFIHLSGSTHMSPDPTYKVAVTSVLYALKMNADGVSVHVNLGVPNEQKMLASFGKISEEAQSLDMPLLAMMYPEDQTEKGVMHAVRVAEELGADFVKTPLPDDPQSIFRITKATNIPILMAGGEAAESFDHFLERSVTAINNGARGVVAGRNIFQRKNPKEAIEILRKCFIEKSTKIHSGYNRGSTVLNR